MGEKFGTETFKTAADEWSACRHVMMKMKMRRHLSTGLTHRDPRCTSTLGSGPVGPQSSAVVHNESLSFSTASEVQNQLYNQANVTANVTLAQINGHKLLYEGEAGRQEVKLLVVKFVLVQHKQRLNREREQKHALNQGNVFTDFMLLHPTLSVLP